MRQRRGRIGTRLAAFAAALVLVLQSALAVAAPPVQRDIFGNVICADGGGGPMPSGDDAAHLPDCCILSCSVLHIDLGQPRSAEVPVMPASEQGRSGFPAPAATPHQRRSPINPRAPPRLA